MVRTVWISLVAVGAVACQAHPSIGHRTEYIVDGEDATEEEEAVVLVVNRFGGLCTGALISPRVVLTAKHCVQSPGATEPSTPSAFVVGIGNSRRRITQQLLVQSVTTTPGVYTSGSRGLEGALVGIDVAVMVLTRGATIEPLPIRREDPTELVGTQAKAVGFGNTPEGVTGTKFRTTTTVSGLRDSGGGGLVLTPPAICEGDSGGPLISADGEVFAVASFGTGSCGSGINGYNRIDLFLELIDAALSEAGDCLDNGAEVCDGFDNDCNDEVDEGCSDIGEPCETVADCVGGEDGGAECADTAGGRICTRSCDPLRPDLGCPPGLYCDRVGTTCEGVCAPGESGSLGNDEACEVDTDCASLFCVDPGDGRKRCLSPCRGNEGMCFSGEVCAAAAGSCNGCVPAELVRGLRGLGEPCAEDADCLSELCFVDEGFAQSTAYCTRECELDAECSEGFHCRVRTDPESGEPEGRCIRGVRPGSDVGAGTTSGPTVGPGCVFNEDCGGEGFCARRGEVRWCTRFCEAGEQCPPAYSCVDAGGTRVCAPDQGIVGSSCEAPVDCISGLCATVDGEAVCARLCGPDAGCPTGFECRRASDGQNAICVMAAKASDEVEDDSGGGGCAVTAAGIGGSGSSAILVLLGLLCCVRRRRRSLDATNLDDLSRYRGGYRRGVVRVRL